MHGVLPFTLRTRHYGFRRGWSDAKDDAFSNSLGSLAGSTESIGERQHAERADAHQRKNRGQLRTPDTYKHDDGADQRHDRAGA